MKLFTFFCLVVLRDGNFRLELFSAVSEGALSNVKYRKLTRSAHLQFPFSHLVQISVLSIAVNLLALSISQSLSLVYSDLVVVLK